MVLDMCGWLLSSESVGRAAGQQEAVLSALWIEQQEAGCSVDRAAGGWVLCG